MKDVIVTRVELSGPSRQSRNVEERLMVRFPAPYRWLAALTVRRLKPHYRLRRAWLRRGFLSGWAAFNRRDFELLLVRYAPNAEFEFPPGQQTLGLSGTFRGHQEIAGAQSELAEGWASSKLELAYVLDLGDSVLGLGFFRVRGRASGLELEQEFAQLVTPATPPHEGLVARDQAWFRWEEGLRAAGLDPDAIALPRPESHVRQSPASSSAASSARPSGRTPRSSS